MPQAYTDYAYIEALPDPQTESYLLHTSLVERSNSRRIHHYKLALRQALRRLTPPQQEQLRLFYGEGMRKSDIARRQNTTCSAVTKSIRASQQALQAYIEMYMEIYNRLELEFMQDEL